jgi:hypothetical protein
VRKRRTTHEKSKETREWDTLTETDLTPKEEKQDDQEVQIPAAHALPDEQQIDDEHEDIMRSVEDFKSGGQSTKADYATSNCVTS